MATNYPTPTITPYLSPAQGGSPNVPRGQTGYSYSSDFIGPIPYNYGAVGQPISSAQIYNPPAPTPTPSGGGQPNIPSPASQDPNAWRKVQSSPNGYYNANGDWVSVGEQGGGEIVKVPEIDPYAQIRGDISSGWDAYTKSLDEQLGFLPGQKETLTGDVQSKFGTGTQDILGQQTLGQQDIEAARTKAGEQQVRSLKDVGSNIENLMNAGQVMLGAKGAGDSSAANMYSYALTKMGSKERGNVMNQTKSVLSELDNREARLSEITNQEKNKLSAWLNTQLTSVATWFQDAQRELTTQKGEAGRLKGQDLANLSKNLLDQATQRAMQAKTQYDNLVSGLTSWAASNSTNISQLRTNIQGVMQQVLPTIQAGQIAGQPNWQGNNFTLGAPTGYGSTEEQNKPFGY